jgi:rRNA maturation endonuclease Nob1
MKKLKKYRSEITFFKCRVCSDEFVIASKLYNDNDVEFCPFCGGIDLHRIDRVVEING